MDIDPQSLSGRDAYHTMISCVIPRPIGWISTIAADGTRNLAPFSFFGGVTTDPMTLMISIGRRRGIKKDTAFNLIDTGEGVVHICDRDLAEPMVRSAAEVPRTEDEFTLAGLETTPSTEVRPPRIVGAKIAMECTVQQHLEVGNGPNDLFLLEVVHIHLDDAVLTDGLPDPAKLRAVGRLGGAGYCDTAAPFEIPRE